MYLPKCYNFDKDGLIFKDTGNTCTWSLCTINWCENIHAQTGNNRLGLIYE